MAKVNAPLLGFGASGQIGKTLVYGTWRGVPYARQHVIPSNPQSTEQGKTRTAWTFLNNVWRLAPTDFATPWTAAAAGQAMFNRNLFLQKNMKWLRPKGGAAKVSLDGLIMSPGAKAGLVAAPAYTVNAGAIVSVADEPSPLPSGWTVKHFTVAAIREQDPQSGILYDVLTDTTDAPSGGSTWTSQIAAVGDHDFAVASWFTYQRSTSALDLAYGPGVAVLETVTG
jgi:hypothetical protein